MAGPRLAEPALRPTLIMDFVSKMVAERKAGRVIFVHFVDKARAMEDSLRIVQHGDL